MISKDQCKGCRDDHYNQVDDGAGRCWSAKAGKMVTRYKIGFMTAPTEKGAYTHVLVPSCYRQPGQFAFHEKLPSFVKASNVRKRP